MKQILAALLLVFVPLTAAAQSAVPRLFEVCYDPAFTANCTSAEIEDIDPQGHELWLRAIYDSNAEPLNREGPRAVYVIAMAASEVYWNGELLGANGTVGATPQEETPGRLEWIIYLPSSLIRDGPNELSIHMSSHHNLTHVVRPVHVIGIGSLSDSLTARLIYYLPALLTAGGLLLAALYFGVTFAVSRREWGALMLAGLALCVVGQLSAELSRSLVAYPYTWHIPRLMIIAGFSWSFACFLSAYVAWRVNRARLLLTVATCAVLGLIALWFVPPYDFKAVAAIAIGALVSLAIPFARPRWPRGSELAIAGALAVFLFLIVFGQGLFLDREFYLAAFALSCILFIGEIIARRDEREAAALAKSRAQSLENELLRRQMSPHFLMNTLNTLAAWVEEDAKKSQDIIEALAAEFRAIERLSPRRLIALSDEIDLCQTHLQLLSFRAEHNFTLEVEGDPGREQVPPAALLTLVENAFSHNAYEGDIALALAIQPEGAQLRLTLTCPMAPGTGTASGTGLGNAYIQSRLVEAYGEDGFAFEEGQEGEYWRAHMTLPRDHG